MSLVYILHGYIHWHYGKAYRDLYRTWRNFLWFVVHFFSIPTLLKTLFAPLNRLDEEYNKDDDLEGKAGTIVINIFVRFLGFFLRSFFILLGVACWFIVFLLGIFSFAFWTVAPVLWIVFIGMGISYL